MRRQEKIDFKSMQKIETERGKNKRWCKHCGHSIIFPKTSKLDKMICTYCGHYIFKNDKIEFETLLKKSIKKVVNK